MAQNVRPKSVEKVSDQRLLACLSESPIRTAAIAIRVGMTSQRVVERLRVMSDAELVKHGRKNLWKLATK